MNKALTLVTGAGLGAALMYVLDPDRGTRRRALIRDQITHAANKTGDAIGATSRDVSHRMKGVVAEAKGRFGGEHVSDDTVRERVRAEMGRIVSHPSSIIATVRDGRVILSGPILAHEVQPFLDRVRSVRGVREVDNRMDEHETAEDVPGLQGGRERVGRESALQENWPPATRVLAGAAGGALALYGAKREDTLGAAIGLIGLSLLARASSNLDVQGLTGLGGGRRAISVQDAINIGAPLKTVFAFWKDYQHFPHWMSHVREVAELEPGHSRWVVDGPAGIPVEWEAVITKEIPNRLLAWESVGDSTVAQTGIIHFSELADGGTHVDIKLSYKPPAGAIGHAVASFFGANPEQQMQDDLVRVKTLLETGRPPHDAAKPVEQVSVPPDVSIQQGEAGRAAP
ncbi:MAG TPA: SRPBCC family protein [Gemmatimonadaceae bacterium]